MLVPKDTNDHGPLGDVASKTHYAHHKDTNEKHRCTMHCVKSVQIRSFFWSVFSGPLWDTTIDSLYDICDI